MQQTAMQELQRRLFDVGTKQRPITVDEMNSFIEKEKQQIIDAYKQGVDDWVVEDISIKVKNKTSERYYNETYKQD